MRWHDGVSRRRLLIVGMIVVLLAVVIAAWQVVPRPLDRSIGATLSEVLVSPNGSHLALNYTEDILPFTKTRKVSPSDIRFNVTIEIRNLATGRLEHRIEHRNAYGTGSMAFSPDSRSLLLSRCANSRIPFHHPDNSLYRFDLSNGKTEEVMSGVSKFWINRNGNTLWTYVEDPRDRPGRIGPTYLVQRDMRTGEELRKPLVLSGRIVSVNSNATVAVTDSWRPIIDRDGKVRRSSWDPTMYVWDLISGKQLACLGGTSYPIHSAAFSLDGKMFAACGISPKSPPVRVWDVQSGQVICTLTGNARNTQKIAFSPDGKELARVNGDGEVMLWDIERAVDDWAWPGKEVKHIAFTPDGKHLITGSNHNAGTASGPRYVRGSLTMLDVETGRPVRTISP